MRESDLIDLLHNLCTPERGVVYRTLETVIMLAVQIAREGREGHRVGTIFVIGDVPEVLRRSRCLILDPLLGHPEALRRLDNVNMRETVKELAQLDGAFVVTGDGLVVSACRYLNASTKGLHLPLGLGSRHVAAASITRDTKALAVVVSESSMIRVFAAREIAAEIIPELWLLRRHGFRLKGIFALGGVPTAQGQA